jgi:hypothetical protein
LEIPKGKHHLEELDLDGTMALEWVVEYLNKTSVLDLSAFHFSDETVG